MGGCERRLEGYMSQQKTINELLVNLFNDIMDMEEKALITGQYKEISVNDMHIIDAIGVDMQRNMSAVARDLSVTVGTLTIAINNLVKKGYVVRRRSEIDRRVVLISLSSKGEDAYRHHEAFHKNMVNAALKNLNQSETKELVTALMKLRDFFQSC